MDPNEFRPPTDDLCKEWKGRVCLNCAERAYFDDQGKCTKVDDNCNTWDRFDGSCLTCYKGYSLNGAACVRDAVVGPTDLGCKTWDWDNQVCLACSARWVFNAAGVCVPVDDFCATHNQDGSCATCYKGYSLNGAACVRDAVVGPTDLGCKTWDWDNQVCLACSARWVFNAAGVCVPVDDFCSTFDLSGVCTSCYKGYNLSNGSCVIANALCKTQSSDGTCSSCYSGYVVYKKQCFPLSKLADITLYYAECCPEKLAELQGKGRL